MKKGLFLAAIVIIIFYIRNKDINELIEFYNVEEEIE